MSEDENANDRSQGQGVPSPQRRVSRREFLKIAGLAGATVGLGAGLGGVVAACGGATTTVTAATTATTAGTTTSVSGAATTATSIVAGPELGREVKIGYVTPVTGAVASLGQADKYLVDKFMTAIGDGIVMGDNKKHPIRVLIEDSQSNGNRASQVAGDLMLNSGVDILVTNTGAELVNAVSDQAEANGVPCLSTEVPWEIWWNGRGGPAKGSFKWTYNACFGVNDNLAMSFNVWPTVPNNKVVGALWPNDADGLGYRKAFPGALAGQGYKVIDGGAFQDGLEDFSSIVGAFKQGGAEIVQGIMAPPDFGTFWKECFQSGYLPKICYVTKPTLFPQGLEALGKIGTGLMTSVWWHPTYPFKSSLTGQTCQEIADEYETKTGKQWIQPLLHFILFEWVADILSRTQNVDDKQQIVDAILKTKIESMSGPIDFTQAVGQGTRPVPNCVRTALAGGQWVTGTGKWPFELVVVDNGLWPMLPVAAKLQPMSAFQ